MLQGKLNVFFPFSRSFRDEPLSQGFSLKKWEKPWGRGSEVLIEIPHNWVTQELTS